jgi:neutral ceramidase
MKLFCTIVRHRRFILLVALALASDFDAHAREGSQELRVGAYAIDITPQQLPVDANGSMTPWQAELVHDPLHARCLVLDNTTTKIAIAVCDSCMIPREIFDLAKAKAAKATGIPADHILCSATHTHTGVAVTRVFQSPIVKEYCAFLADRIAEGIIQADARREPARIGWAVGNNPRQVFNRRWHLRPGSALTDPFDRGADKVQMNPAAASVRLLKPAGPSDPEIPILAMQALDGRPIAVLANYSLHYVGGVPPRSLSADYFGEFARQFARLIEAEKVEPPFVGIMSNGTSGDINNVNFFEGATSREPFEQIRLVAADVAKTARAAYQRIEWQEWVPLEMREAEIDLGVRRPTEDEVAHAKDILQHAGERPHSDLRAIYAQETLDLAEYPATMRVKLQAIRIGDAGIASSPCETFVETGLAIKKESPLPLTFTIELANGCNGYLPTPEQHALGGYETWRAKSSYLAVDAEPKVRNTLLRLLRDVTK